MSSSHAATATVKPRPRRRVWPDALGRRATLERALLTGRRDGPHYLLLICRLRALQEAVAEVIESGHADDCDEAGCPLCHDVPHFAYHLEHYFCVLRSTCPSAASIALGDVEEGDMAGASLEELRAHMDATLREYEAELADLRRGGGAAADAGADLPTLIAAPAPG